MPYKKVSELPPGVKDNLPKAAAEIYLAAFNSAETEYGDAGEKRWAQVAWTAVKTKYEKDDAGKWRKKAKVTEADAPPDSLEALRDMLHDALRDSGLFPKDVNGYMPIWIRWTLADALIVEYKNRNFQIGYAVDEFGTVTFSEPVEVKITYTITPVTAEPGTTETAPAVTEADIAQPGFIETGVTRILEADAEGVPESIRTGLKEGEYPIAIIKAGEYPHSRRIYTEALVQEGAQMFLGRRMYLNHPSQEDAGRGHRDIRAWVGMIRPGRFAFNTVTKEAIGVAYIFDPWLRGRLADAEFRSMVGVSICGMKESHPVRRADGLWEHVDKITAAESVDWVPAAGAGGKVTEAFEARISEVDPEARRVTEGQLKENGMETPQTPPVTPPPVSETERKAVIKATVLEADFPPNLRDAVIGRVSTQVAGVTDGTKLQEAVTAAVQGEKSFIAEAAKIAPNPGGAINPTQTTQPTGDSVKSLLDDCRNLGGQF